MQNFILNYVYIELLLKKKLNVIVFLNIIVEQQIVKINVLIVIIKVKIIIIIEIINKILIIINGILILINVILIIIDLIEKINL
jgi:hypothetical protein